MTLEQAIQLGVSHHQAGRLPEAQGVYQHILSVLPGHPDVLHLSGVASGQMGQVDLAVELIGRAIAIHPTNPAFHFNHGIFLEKQGKLEQAAASYQRAVDLNSDYLEAQIHLGNAWRSLKQLDRALECYERAARLQPNSAEALISLGNIQMDRGEVDQAIAHLEHALRLNTDHAQARASLATALIQKGAQCDDADQAIDLFRRAVQINPDDGGAHFHLANALIAQDKVVEAIESYNAAVARYQSGPEFSPDLPRVLCMLGHALTKNGESGEAMNAFLRALGHDPNSAMAADLILYSLLFDLEENSKSILAKCLDWNDRFAAGIKPVIAVYDNDPDPNRRLRIGYVSADFRRHVANHFMLPLLASHDRLAVEIYCYANVKQPDEMTQTITSLADHWRNLAGMDDDDAATLIRRDRIDVLVDLNLHTADNRLLLFARKPAPVQVCWLGYPGTTGLAAMDYRLTDPYLDPPDADDSVYSEQSIRLPDTFWCYDPLDQVTPVCTLPAYGSGIVTFGCLNHFQKINDQVLEVWAEVLHGVIGSRLLMLAPEGTGRERACRRMEGSGIEPHRIEFVGRQSRLHYLQTFHQIDISLDPFPCNGHTTSLDSLWMGVPVVTLAGKTVAGRAGVSQLSNLGLTELIAHSKEEYVRIASSLAQDLPALGELRLSLRERMLQSPLMDAPRFARGMESAYREMWTRWTRNRS